MRSRVVLCVAMMAACRGDDGGDREPPVPDPDVVLDIGLGHVKPIQAIWRADNRILSRDSSLHWVLWDVLTRRELASGDQTSSYLALAGGTMTAQQPGGAGIEVRSVATGALLATISTSDASNFGIASDGSYVWLAKPTSIEVWTTTGTKLLTVTGDYSRAAVFAAPGELRLSSSSRATQTVETWQLPSGARTTIPIAGQFAGWFDDGEHFLTAVGTTTWVYSRTGEQIAFADLPAFSQVAGQGNHVWTFDGGTLRIYLANELSAPIQSFALVHETPFAAGSTIALVGSDLELISLGATVTRGAPIGIACTAFGGDAAAWAIGTAHGLVFDSANVLGPPAARQSYSTGELLGLAGAPDGTAALSTESGMLMLRVDGTTARVERTLPLFGSHLELTTDGSTMVVADARGNAVHVVTVVDGQDRHTFDAPDGLDFALAPSGGRLALIQFEASGVLRLSYRDLEGAPVPAAGPDTAYRFMFSPDGTHAAATMTTGPNGLSDLGLINATTQLYAGGVLIGAIGGVGELWLDDSRLIAASYSWVHSVNVSAVTLYGPTGTGLASLPGMFSRAVTSVGDDLVYIEDNVVASVATGEMAWAGERADLAAVVGNHAVIYARGPRLYLGSFH